jgi:hypothetical protein
LLILRVPCHQLNWDSVPEVISINEVTCQAAISSLVAQVLMSRIQTGR